MKTILILAALLFTPAAMAIAPKGALVNNIVLPKGGYLVLQVTDAQKEVRHFLVTCELNLPQDKLEALSLTGTTHTPLKAKEYQSLINHWLTPAVDHYIVCTQEAITTRKKK